MSGYTSGARLTDGQRAEVIRSWDTLALAYGEEAWYAASAAEARAATTVSAVLDAAATAIAQAVATSDADAEAMHAWGRSVIETVEQRARADEAQRWLRNAADSIGAKLVAAGGRLEETAEDVGDFATSPLGLIVGTAVLGLAAYLLVRR